MSMRIYTPVKSETMRLEKHRYLELKRFCLQYPRWLVEARDALELSAVKMDGMPHGTDVGDPTERAVEKREVAMSHIDMVDRCAKSVGDGVWFNALIHNVCLDETYEEIKLKHPEFLPTSKRVAFTIAKARFFTLLDEARK